MTRSIVTAAALAVAASTLTVAGQGTAQAAGLCAGLDRCRIVDRADVDGDGDRDRIAWIQRSERSATVKVRTADGQVLSRTVDVTFWPGGGAYAGSSTVDGRPGAELLVASRMGAHTPSYTMLTFRRGQLREAPSPSGDEQWWVDNAYAVSVGWHRSIRKGQVRMANTTLFRADGKWNGTRTTYAWKRGDWQVVDRSKLNIRTKAAQNLAGFHIRGLDAFPAVR